MLSKKITPIQEDLNRRFFEAVATLEQLGRLPSLSGFCEENGLSAPRYRELRLKYGPCAAPDGASRYTYVETEAIYYLITRYSVSARWLYTGKGRAFTR